VILSISGTHLFFCLDFFKSVLADLAGETLAEQLLVAKKTLYPHTHNRPPICHPLTPRHYTSTSPPTTPYLLIPTAPTSRTFHPRTLHSKLPPTPSTRRIRHFCSIVFPKYSSQSMIHTGLTTGWALSSVNHQPWRFTNNSLGLPHTHSLSVCLFSLVCVVCVCFLLCLSVYLCFARCVYYILFHVHFTFLLNVKHTSI